MRNRSVGLDVHKRVIEACVLDPAGRIVLRHRFPCTRDDLVRFGRSHLRPSDRLALESTTNTWIVVDTLGPFVTEIVVSNPLKTRAIAESRVKTDKVDAFVLAQLLRCDYLPRVWIPPVDVRTLRRLTGRRVALVCDRSAIKNRLQALFAQNLLLPPVTTLFSKAGLAWMRTVEMPPPDRRSIDSDLRLIESIDREIEALDQDLLRSHRSDGRVQLLMTLPGVSHVVALTLLAALGDLSRFPSADHAVGYLGLAPRTKQSAERCSSGPITKQGSGHARAMLVQAAQNVRSHPGPLGFFFRKLAKKKHHNVAIVALARKLVVIAWHMLKNNEPYRYATPGITAGKLARLRVRGGGNRLRPGLADGSEALAQRKKGIHTRTLPAINDVYRREGLPLATSPADLRPGEKRHLDRIGGAAHCRAVHSRQRSVLRPNAPKKASPRGKH